MEYSNKKVILLEIIINIFGMIFGAACIGIISIKFIPTSGIGRRRYAMRNGYNEI